MAVVFTEEQNRAITHGGGTLLVSAAAGSGKTAVLVQRILRSVCDPANPKDIDRFIVVTFTNAAAAEMRTKITRELTQRLAADPANRHLLRQLTLAGRARICTVHAFCLDLIRANSHLLDISPDLRILDDAEAGLLMDQVFERLAEELFERPEETGVAELVEAFSDQRSDARFKELILSLYRKMQSRVAPKGRLQRYREMVDAALRDGLRDHPWCRQLTASLAEFLTFYRQLLTEAVEELRTDVGLDEKYGPVLRRDIAFVGEIAEAAERGWDELSAFLTQNQPPKLPMVRSPENPTLKNRCKALHDRLKEQYRSWREGPFSISAADHLDDISATRPTMESLCATVEAFGRAYTEEKRQMNAADFSDIEHLAVSLLVQRFDEETGAVTPTPLALELALATEEVMVDEYQDTNEIQDAIFRSITDLRHNLFMVGDVKQSIYRFRMADPTIFLRKQRSFSEDGEDPVGTRVRLSGNFRSRGEVIDTVNGIFSKLMSSSAGDVDYRNGEELVQKADYPPADGMCAELVMLSGRTGDEESEDSQEGEDPSETEAEAAYIADRISGMLKRGFEVCGREGRKRRCNKRDFVILLRSVRNRAEIFRQALSQRGIASFCEQNDDFLMTPEILVMVSFLSVIDNPRQDVALAAVLRSPVFAFSAEELAAVRLQTREGSLYDALLLRAKEDAKAAGVTALLLELRALSADSTTGDLIFTIYERTGMLPVYGAKENGPLRRANLHAFYELARRYEEKSYRGLYSFVSYLRGLYETESGLRGASAVSENADAVRIMSIHKSKGLEFPVVFIGCCGKRFNTSDVYESILVDDALGIGIKRREPERGIEYTTLPREAVAERIRRDLQSEELRIFYVAMTRAQEKLILTASAANLQKKAGAIAPLVGGGTVHPLVIRQRTSYLDWLLCAVLAERPDALQADTVDSIKPFTVFSSLSVEVRPASGALFTERQENGETGSAVQAPEVPEVRENTVTEILRRIRYRYPAQAAVTAPSKLTATQLKGGYFDPEIHDGNENSDLAAVFRKPFFISEKKGPDAAEAGTAMHLCMQYLDFDRCGSKEEIRHELNRLADNKLITREQAAWVSAGDILKYLSTPIAKRMAQAVRMEREYKFSILMEARRYDPEMRDEIYRDEKILLQGIADCVFIEKDGTLVVLDFKTDRVSAETVQSRAEQYRPQVEAYALALARIFGRDRVEKWLYFFTPGRAVGL